MRVFVTGASGLIGSHLCRQLLQRGDAIVALSRRPMPDPRIEWIQGRVEAASEWAHGVAEADAVVNLAGASISRRWTLPRMHEIVRSRVGITTALYHALARRSGPPPVVISASAIGFYGTDLESSFDESSPPGSGFLADVCQEWEKAALRMETLGVRLVRLRIGVVLARDGGALPALVRPVRAFLGGALGSGRQWISWIHLDDLVRMILFLIDTSRAADAINAVAPAAMRQRDLVRRIGATLGRPIWLDAPGPVLELALGRMARELLLQGQRVEPKVAAELGFSYRFADIDEALRDLLL